MWQNVCFNDRMSADILRITTIGFILQLAQEGKLPEARNAFQLTRPHLIETRDPDLVLLLDAMDRTLLGDTDLRELAEQFAEIYIRYVPPLIRPEDRSEDIQAEGDLPRL